MVTGRMLEIAPVALRLRPVTTPSMVMVTIEAVRSQGAGWQVASLTLTVDPPMAAVRSQRTVCQLRSLTLTVDPAPAALFPAEPRNRQTILPLGCSNFQYPPFEPAWPFWTPLPKEGGVRIR